MRENVPEIGQKPPVFDVLRSDGNLFRLEQILKLKKNVLLMFYRGNW